MTRTINQIKHRRLEDEFGNILVRRVIKRNDWAAEAIFDIAAGDKKEWTPIEWAAVLCDLKRCRLKVTDWLSGEECENI